MLNLDGSSLDVVLYEMVFDVDEFSAFGGATKIVALLSAKRRGRFCFGRLSVSEEAPEQIRLLGCRCSC